MAENRIRQGVHNLTDQQVGALRDAYRQMMALTDNRGYAFFAGIHGAPDFWCWHHERSRRNSGVRMQIFLPWHRAYLYHFEMAARDRVSDVTLPWWDWTLRPPRQDGVPSIFAARTANGGRNPLFSFRINLPDQPQPIVHDTVRQPGDVNDLPAQGDVDAVIASTDWTDFNFQLESVHDNVHGWVGGDMGVVATSAYDPIFWSHHTMIDRIWWLWQARNGNGNIPTNLLDVVLAPFNFRVRDVLNVNDLGYDYAAAQGVIPIGGP